MTLPRWVSLKPVVPKDWTEVTPAWMTQAISSRHPDSIVGKVTLVSSDDGTNRRARFALEYAQGDGPRQVFVKAHAPSHRLVHLRNGNLWGESRLLASKANIPVEHPLSYLAVPDYPRLDFLLVMEDITLRGGDPRDALRPLSPEQAASGVRGLAALHREYWDMTASLHPNLRWVKRWTPSKGWTVGMGKRIPTGLVRAEGKLSASIETLGADKILDNWVRFVRSLGDAPGTLLHGDAHIGNTYVLPDDELGFLDWQVVRRGHWSQDLGYFLIGALTPEDRRAHERDLIEVYRNALGFTDERLPSADEAWRRYRMSPPYGLAIWLSTLGTDGWQEHAVSLALVQRYAAAMEELDSASALDEAGV